MTHDTAPPPDSPHELLTAVRDLTRRVRIAQRATWFPLLVFALLYLAAIPVYRYSPRHPNACRSGPGGTYVCASVWPWVQVYWPVALLLAYAVIAGFYVYQSRRRGVGARIRPYVVAGVVIAALLAAGSLWLAYHPLIPSSGPQIFGAPSTQFVYRLAKPAVAIGLALLVLTWVERNRALLAFSLAYLVIVLIPPNFGRPVTHPSPWDFLPALLTTATVLLLGSLGFALLRPAERRPR